MYLTCSTNEEVEAEKLVRLALGHDAVIKLGLCDQTQTSA